MSQKGLNATETPMSYIVEVGLCTPERRVFDIVYMLMLFTKTKENKCAKHVDQTQFV